MARSRNIKPGFFTNPELVELPYETRLLFAGLWVIADRDGRLEDRPKKIKMELFPADAVDCDMMLGQLHKAGFVIRYEVDGQKLIQVNNWAKHQSPHHTERASTLPPLGEHGALTVKSPLQDGGNPPDSLIHRFTDSSPTDVGEVAPCAPAPKAPKGSRLAEDWFLPRAWGEWALEKFPAWTPDIVRTEAEKFRDHWLSESGQKARKADWFATWRKWCSSDIAQRAHAPPSSASKETPYAAHMRQRVEQAAGSLAHIVAAKAPGQRPREPWEVAADEQQTIEAGPARTIAIGMD